MSQGYFDDEGPGEHDQHLLDTDEVENDIVACPDCDGELLAFADRCHHCGAHFGGEAWQIAQGRGRWSPLAVTFTALLLIVLMLTWLMR